MTNHDKTDLPQRPSLQQAADHFGVSTKTVRRWLADGRVRGYRVGRLIRLDRDSLLAMARPMGGAL